MAGNLLQLKLATLRGSLRADSPRRPWTIGVLAASLCGLLAALGAVVVLDGLLLDRAKVALVFGGLLVSIVTVAVAGLSRHGELVDQRSLAEVGLPPGRAAWSALGASFLGPPALCLALALLASLWLWRADPVALLVGAAAAVVAVCTLVTLSRLASLFGEYMNDRGVSGDIAVGVLMLGVLAASPVIFVLLAIPWGSGATEVMELPATVLAWSPFAAVWAAPATAAAEGPVAGAAQLGVALLTLGALLVLWRVFGARSASRMLVDASVPSTLDLGMFRTFAGTPAGVIASRILRAWVRDRRYRVVNMAVILVPLLSLLPLAIAGVAPQYLVLLPVPLLAFLLGWALHNDLAFDSTAVWLHITAAMDGFADRLGRALPTLWIGSVLVVLGSLVTVPLTGSWWWSLSMLGVSAGLLFTATGSSSIMSARAPYAVARPGDSPFSQPVHAWGASVVRHALAGLLSLLAMLPSIALAVIGIASGQWWWHLAAAGLGLLTGLVALRRGLVRGGRVYEERASELMVFAMSA